MQFKVPQNIDMQDKIIGPLTLTQFFYLLFGGIIIYILFTKLAITGYSFIFWILAIPLGLISFALAFVKIQDQPFPTFAMSLVKFIQLPRMRVWQHYTAPVAKNPTVAKTKKDEKVVHKQLDTLRVGELSEMLDDPKIREGADG